LMNHMVFFHLILPVCDFEKIGCKKLFLVFEVAYFKKNKNG